MSDVSRGPGWWLASDGKWYAPELHPNYRSAPTSPGEDDSRRGPGADGTAAPASEVDEHETVEPETVPPAKDVPAAEASAPERAWTADAPQGEGWWQGTDGKWYAPELYPSETPRADDWWQAANGRWYPPLFHPDEAVRAAATTSTGQRRDEQRRAEEVRAAAATGAPTSPGGSPSGPVSGSGSNVRTGAGTPEEGVPADVTGAGGRVAPAQQAAAATGEAWTMVASSGSLTLSHSQHEYAVYDNERTFGRWPLGDEGYRDAVEAFQKRKNEIEQ